MTTTERNQARELLGQNLADLMLLNRHCMEDCKFLASYLDANREIDPAHIDRMQMKNILDADNRPGR